MSFSYALNGVPLDARNCAVITGSSLLAPITTARDVLRVTGRHGSVRLGRRLPVEERSLTLIVRAFTPEAYAMAQRLMRICMQPTLTISRKVDGVMSQTPAELASLTPNDDVSDPDRFMEFTAVFALTDVFWRDPAEFQLSLNVNGTYSWPDSRFGDAPVDRLIYRFPHGVTSLNVWNDVSGTSVKWSGTASNAYLYLDVPNMRAWKSTLADGWSASGDNMSAGIDYGTGGLLEMWPDATGAYRLGIQSTGASGQCVMRGHRAWW